ncbi:hypothetical protein HZC30_05790 [Candidatus Woesearchaeota archaeon]|nr:hypothetical protein [Candidatus Woesearchaeota archaeon]
MTEDPDFKGGSSKYYIAITVAIVVILGGVFFWAIQFGGFDITGASAADMQSEAAAGTTGDEKGALDSSTVSAGTSGAEGNTVSGSAGTTATSNSRSISDTGSLRKPGTDVKVSLDTIPTINAPTRIEDLEIKFSNLNTNIRVNKEALELTSLDKIDLKVHGFSGNIILNERTLSLEGKVTKLDVNGVVLSSNELEISFAGLDYESVSTIGMDLTTIELFNSKGKLESGQGKVSFEVEPKDRITLTNFLGEGVMDKKGNVTLSLDGIVKGINTVGTVDVVLQ